MKFPIAASLILLVGLLISCDLRSDTAKREMEKFSGTPTPTIAPVPELPPVDPADVVNVDTTQDGPLLSVNGNEQKKNLDCNKYNLVNISSYGAAILIKGVCHRIVVNGDSNQISVDASMEFVFNGSGNKVTYSKYPNGKRPLVVQNQSDNTVEQVAAGNLPQNTTKSTKK